MEQTQGLKNEIIEKLEPLFSLDDQNTQRLRREIHRQLGWIISVSKNLGPDGLSSAKIVGNFNIEDRRIKKAWENIKHQIANSIAEVLTRDRAVSGKPKGAEKQGATDWLDGNNVKKLVKRLGRDFKAFIHDEDGMACLTAWARKIRKERSAEEKLRAISFHDVYGIMMERIFGERKKETEAKIPKEAVFALFKSLLSRKYRCKEDEIDFSDASWQEKLVNFVIEEKLWYHTHKAKLNRYRITYAGYGEVTLYQCLYQYMHNINKDRFGKPFHRAFAVFCKDYFGFNYDAVYKQVRRARNKKSLKKHLARAKLHKSELYDF